MHHSVHTLTTLIFTSIFCFTVGIVSAQETVVGCEYPTACNYNPDATEGDGSCIFPDANYDCDGNCILDLNNNGLCDLDEVAGCTFEDAVNYDPMATLDDGSCMVTCKGDFNNDGIINASDLLGFLTVFGASCDGGGCMDTDGCNYDPNATFDFDYCEYPEEFYDCEGICLNDSDGDGVCDELEVLGCTDPEASNYDPEATDDDGSCQFGSAQYPEGMVWCDGVPTEVVDVINPATGKTWMDRNLGASEAPNGDNLEAARGDLYQWGRGADGHQCRNSTYTIATSSTNQPGHDMFIIINGGTNDWRNPQNMHLWQGLNGINVPCPEGYRLPTEAEANAERLTWPSNNATGAAASPIKLTATGYRSGATSSILALAQASYWTSTTGTVVTVNSKNLQAGSGGASISEHARATGRAVRCIKHEP